MEKNNLDGFHWGGSTVSPWFPGKPLYFHMIMEPDIFEASWIEFDPACALDLNIFFHHLPPLISLQGLKNTVNRYCDELPALGLDFDAAFGNAVLGTSILCSGLISSIPNWVHAYGLWEERGKEDPFLFPLSPIHFWAAHECVRILRLEISPSLEETGLIGFWPEHFEDCLARLQTYLKPFYDLLSGPNSPFLFIEALESREEPSANPTA